MMPYILWGGQFTFTNAWFESVSGYTTTGSSILTNIEAVPKGLLFWRASTHWLGGMGIIMFVLAVLPSLGIASMVLYRAEMSPVAQESFRQNARSTLRILLAVYVGLTAAETILLWIAGMNLYDAVTHSFATIATGGFSPHNASIAYYDSPAIEMIIIVFMILSGIHFGLLFSAIFERSKELWKSTIVRYYIIIMLIGIAVTTIDIHGSVYKDWGEALRYAAFQVTSIGTSTGFANTNSNLWPNLSQLLLMFFALQCATAGSTSGGIKGDRMVMLGKSIWRQLKMLQHPRAVIAVKLNGRKISDEALSMGLLYIAVYILVVFIGAMLLIMFGVDMLSAFSGTIATTGNVGPGFGLVGSTSNFAQIPTPGKWILTATMLLGRLEIYGMIIFFLPNVWKLKSDL